MSPQTPQFRRPPRMLIAFVTAIFVLLAVVPILVGFYTDWLWFGDVDFRGVFNKVILTRIGLFILYGGIAAFIIWLACWLTYRGRPQGFQSLNSDSPLMQPEYRDAISSSVRKMMIWLPLFVGVGTGILGQQSWQSFQLFLNRQSFGAQDPQFHKDYGFYAFDLPVITMLLSTLSILVALGFFVTLVGNYLLGGIQMGNRAAGVKGHVSKNARVLLACWAGTWMLLRVASYWFQRYTLLYQSQGENTFTGAGYTDINAVLPSKIILMVIALVVAFSFFSVIVLKDFRIPAVATVLMLVSSLVLGTVWPMFMERFSVLPNRAEKESEFIARNIEATRYAYGITNDKVTYLENWGTQPDDSKLTEVEQTNDQSTINNIRLLDPEVLSPTFTQLEQLKNFYGFPKSLAMDRYTIDGELRDFVVAAREIDPNALRENQKDWINRHTVYTHGNGFIAAQANKVDAAVGDDDIASARGGLPVFTVSDLQGNEGDVKEVGINVTQPRVYFGPVIASAEDNADYSIVGSNNDTNVEYDTDTSTYTYQGTGGVSVGNIVNRAAYAIKYQEMNFLLSERVNENSKVLYDRDPRERVHKVAPWLTTDANTYPTVIDGKIKWIVDGYTTLSSLPYAQRTDLDDATNDATAEVGAGGQRAVMNKVGYIRNSVKAVVDAYDGTVDLYEFDEQDPVLKAWSGVFPGTVKDKSEISPELMAHLRYPEDIYKVQRSMLAKYHVDNAREFFTNDRFWSVPSDPTVPENKNQPAPSQPPYYVVAGDPKTGKPSFQLMTVFRGLNREYLTAQMTVSSQPENYGHMTVRVLPTDTQTQGPKQVQDSMTSSDKFASDKTLWEGSVDLISGKLLTLPVGKEEVLYVEPIYSKRKAQESAFPKLLRVLVSYRGEIGYAATIQEALKQVGIDPAAAQELPDDGGSLEPGSDKASDSSDKKDAGNTSKPATGSGAEGAAIQEINDALAGLEAARDGSFEEYGRALDKLDKAVENYQSIESK